MIRNCLGGYKKKKSAFSPKARGKWGGNDRDEVYEHVLYTTSLLVGENTLNSEDLSGLWMKGSLTNKEEGGGGEYVGGQVRDANPSVCRK